MKSIFSLIISGFIFLGTRGQGIGFVHNLDSALAMAKAEKKMVFVDFYTSWCGPCKVLAAEVFPLPEVGSYYNSNFVNCKIQCDDKGEGEILGKKYKIHAYPTLMFMDEKGNTIHSIAGGLDAKGLIDLAKTAQDPNKNQLAMVQEWGSGNRSHAFMVRYFGMLTSSYRGDKAITDFESWFAGIDKKQKSAKATFDLIELVKSAPFSAPFEYMENNKKAFYTTVGQHTVDSFIATTYLWYLHGVQSSGLINKDLTKYNAAMAKFKAKKYPYYDEYAEFNNVFDSKGIDGKDDINVYMKRGTDFLAKYGKKNDGYTLSLASMLGNWTGGKDKGYAGIKWMEELLSRNRDPRYLNTYFYILWRNYHWEEALEVAYEIRENQIKAGRPTADIDKQIEQVKGWKIKYSQKNNL